MTGNARKQQLERELTRLLPDLVAKYQPDKVILFGSLASGNVHEWSDLDLAIVKQTPKRFLDRISDVFLTINPTVGCDVLVYTPEEIVQMLADNNRFMREEILQQGKVVYERK